MTLPAIQTGKETTARPIANLVRPTARLLLTEVFELYRSNPAYEGECRAFGFADPGGHLSDVG